MANDPRIPTKEFLESIGLQHKERYLPSTMDESHTILEKLNRMGYDVNKNTEITKEVITKWNEFSKWLDTEFDEDVQEKIKKELTNEKIGLITTPVLTRLIDNKLTNINNQLTDIIQVNVKQFGARGDGLTDDTQAIIQAYQYCVSKKPAYVYFPPGIYVYTNLGVLKESDVGFVSTHEKNVILKCINDSEEHTCLEINAFNPNTVTPIKYNFVLKNIVISGNEKSKTGILVQGFTKLDWENIYVKNVGGIGSIAYHLKGVHISSFKNVSHGNNYTGIQTSRPSVSMLIDRSSRGGIYEGSSTNNQFVNCQWESSNIGLEIIYGDQNVFNACATQGNTLYGTVCRQNARYNNFIGMASEKNTSKIDIEDGGRTNNFFNCYTEYQFKAIGTQGNILGGVLSNLIMGGIGYLVNGVRVNGRGVNDGGLVVTADNVIHNVYDLFLNKFVYPLEDRKSITVSESPFNYVNTSQKMMEVIIQSGVATSIQKKRNGNTFLVSNTLPNTYLLAPNEELIVTYTSTPSMSFITYNGY